MNSVVLHIEVIATIDYGLEKVLGLKLFAYSRRARYQKAWHTVSSRASHNRTRLDPYGLDISHYRYLLIHLHVCMFLCIILSPNWGLKIAVSIRERNQGRFRESTEESKERTEGA